MTYYKENCHLQETSCSSGNARRKILRFRLLFLFIFKKERKPKKSMCRTATYRQEFSVLQVTKSRDTRETIRAIHSAQKWIVSFVNSEILHFIYFSQRQRRIQDLHLICLTFKVLSTELIVLLSVQI